MLSCSTGETMASSSGVGIVRWQVRGDYKEGTERIYMEQKADEGAIIQYTGAGPEVVAMRKYACWMDDLDSAEVSRRLVGR
jgi:hypothetical protein